MGPVRSALAVVGSERNIAVHREYRIQHAAGDPSPARTVGATFGLKPDNVRQIDSRMRSKLRTLSKNDPAYADLSDLRWLA